MARSIFVYRCSSGQYEVCEEMLIKAEETRDPQVVLEGGDHTECWKCGASLEFVETK